MSSTTQQGPINCKTATHAELVTAFNKRLPIEGITAILTHPSPHMDEITSMVVLQQEGERLFPGICHSQVGFTTDTSLRENELTGFHGFIDALAQGFLIIGLGGGPFDEHGNREKKVSCLELTIQHLDIYRDEYKRKVYGSFVQYVNFEDNNGDNLIQNMNKANPDHALTKLELEALRNLQQGTIARTLKMGFEIAETDDQRQQTLYLGIGFVKTHLLHTKKFIAARAEYETAPKKKVTLPNNTFALIITSDNQLIGKIVQQKHPDTQKEQLVCTVIKKASKTGNGYQFAIMPKNEAFKNHSMLEIKKILHQISARNRNDKSVGFHLLSTKGTCKEVPELYFDENMHILMNGSKTDTGVPGILGVYLTEEDIVNAITTVGYRKFDNRNAKHCQVNRCVKLANNTPCSLFSFCLSQCKPVQEKTKILTTK